MTNSSFELGSDKAINEIKAYISVVAKYKHDEYRKSGCPINIIIDNVAITSAIELAEETIHYHGIDEIRINNLKRFGHLCFWLTKLRPVTYISDMALAEAAAKLPADYLFKWTGLGKHTGVIKIEPNPLIHDVEDPVNTVPFINEEISIGVFSHLVSGHSYTDPKAIEVYKNFKKTAAFREMVRSLRFHNSSARATALHLEALCQDKVL